MADPAAPWHARPAPDVLAELGSDPNRGLSAGEAARRLVRAGPNALASRVGPRWPALLARQFADVLIALLAVAATVSFLLGETVDGAAILGILFFNGLLGFVQEWRAERAIGALRRMLAPRCPVLRDGHRRELSASELVPGDVVPLETGARVPADLRLVDARDLFVDESALTGESTPVAKGPDPVADATPLAERRPMAWMGTSVTGGRGVGVVVATGPRTEFGRIAALTESVQDERTPLQARLAVLGGQLGGLAVGVSALVAVAGWWLGRPALEMFSTAVSLAVAVVPEGLPAVVTITLALGVRAMVRRRALLRRLPAAETLGSATVVCTDKTGTLTLGEMSVRRVWLRAGLLEVGGDAAEPRPERADLRAVLEAGRLCNRASLERQGDGWRALGEPTEAALLVAASEAGLDGPPEGDPIAEFAFSSERKRMGVVRDGEGGRIAWIKGAPETVLERCTRVLDVDQERPLASGDRDAAERAYAELAASGLRTLALARRQLPPDTPLEADAVEADLTLLGIVGILDPPRAEARKAVATARSAGIRVVMLTGDAAPTALAIASRVGLEADRAVSGPEIDKLEDAALRDAIERGAVFARTTPEHKLRIVDALQAVGHVVAMTGDGVNDAPALKSADIGIAMGVRGTDVAKAASDMILTDDDFASIVAAVEEGRRQYDNIQKFVRYLLSSNVGEVTAIFVNVLLGGPLILLPAQILWMNLVTDGITAVALGVEPTETGVMERRPRPRRQPILDRGGLIAIAGLGGSIGLATLVLFQWQLGGFAEPGGGMHTVAPAQLARAQTLAFTAMIALELANVLNFRTLRAPLPLVGWLSNPWLLASIAAAGALQVAAVHVPFLQAALHTAALSPGDWALAVAVAAPLFLVCEAIKRLRWAHRPGAGAGVRPDGEA